MQTKIIDEDLAGLEKVLEEQQQSNGNVVVVLSRFLRYQDFRISDPSIQHACFTSCTDTPF